MLVTSSQVCTIIIEPRLSLARNVFGASGREKRRRHVTTVGTIIMRRNRFSIRLRKDILVF